MHAKGLKGSNTTPRPAPLSDVVASCLSRELVLTGFVRGPPANHTGQETSKGVFE